MKNFIQKKMANEKTILGIDPGSMKLGWGLIYVSGDNFRLIDRGLIAAKPQRLPYHERLAMISSSLEKVLKKRKPSEIIIEDIYMKSINTRTALTIGKTFGYFWCICEKASPKSSILSMHATAARGFLGENKFSDKKSVRYSVANHLNMADLEEESLDITDALALCLGRAIQIRGEFN